MARFRSLVRPEFKNHDTAEVDDVTTTTVIHDMTEITQGDTGAQRTGNRVTLKSQVFNCQMTVHPSAIVSFCRVIIFLWKDTDAPVVTDILESEITGAQYNLLNTVKYRVLKDFYFKLDDAMQGKVLKYFHKHTLPLQWSTSTASATNQSIHILLLSSESTNAPRFTWRNRMRFIDN